MSDQLQPEDIDALMGLAGQVVMEASQIDNSFGNDRPKSGGSVIGNSVDSIKQALSRDVEHNRPKPAPPAPVAHPQMVPPQAQHIPAPAPAPHQPQAVPLPHITAPEPSTQLEFDFSESEQKETNRLLSTQNVLLSKISDKLTRIVELLDDRGHE